MSAHCCFLAYFVPGLALIAWPPWVSAQTLEITATATHDQKKPLNLSESLNVTLTVEGPSPLRVELPRPLLVPETDRDWRIQPIGPATVTPLRNGGERWLRVFRLDPYVAGDAMTIHFATLKVNDKEVPGPHCEIAVVRPAIEPNPAAAMKITGIEPLASPPPEETSLYWPWILLAVALTVIVVLVARVRRAPRPIAPDRWVAEALDRLTRADIAPASLVEGISAALRGYFERRFHIPASKLTTDEISAAAEQAAWPVEQSNPLRQILEECDRVKFAGDVPDDDWCRSLLARAREWVEHVGPEPRPG